MRLFRIANVAFAVLCVGFLLPACSNDGEPDASGFTDEEFITQLIDAKVGGTYVSTDYKLYDQPTGESGWKEIDLSSYIGWESSLPSTIVLENGKSHVPFEFFHCVSGPTVFSIPWGAYERRFGHEGIYLTRDFSYDGFQRTVTFGANTYDVISFNKNEIQISYVSPYSGGKNQNGGHHKEVMKYSKEDSPGIDGVNNHSFANTHEIYQFIIDKCREKLGDEFDVNAIYYPYVEYPRAILRLSDYENFLQFMKDHGTYDWNDDMFKKDWEIYQEYDRLVRLCAMSNPRD